MTAACGGELSAARISLINNPAVPAGLAMAGVFSGGTRGTADTIDVNENKIADDWEYLHFGRLLAPGEVLDPDKDGPTTWVSLTPIRMMRRPDGHGHRQPPANCLSPRAVDTDDDGTATTMKSGRRNPLSATQHRDYYFKVLDGQTVTFGR